MTKYVVHATFTVMCCAWGIYFLYTGDIESARFNVILATIWGTTAK